MPLLPAFVPAKAFLPTLHGKNYRDNGNHEKIEKRRVTGLLRKEFTNSANEVIKCWSSNKEEEVLVDNIQAKSKVQLIASPFEKMQTKFL